MENESKAWFSCRGGRYLMIPRIRHKLVCSDLAHICSSFCLCESDWKPNSSVVLEVGMGRGEWKRFNTHTQFFSPISLFLTRAYPLWPLLLLFFLIFTLLYFAHLVLLLLLAVFNDVMTGRVFIMLQLPVLSPSNNSPVSGKVWQSNLFLDCETDHEAEKKLRS